MTRGHAARERTLVSIAAEYALRAVVLLSREPGRPWTTQRVAEATGVPASYLSKVLQALVRAEIIQSVRGMYGGYKVSVSVTELTALDIINAVDPIRRFRCCPLGLSEHGVRLCPLHRRVDEAIALTEKAFAETTVGELLAEPGDSSECRFPAAAGRSRPAGERGGLPVPGTRPPASQTRSGRKSRRL